MLKLGANSNAILDQYVHGIGKISDDKYEVFVSACAVYRCVQYVHVTPVGTYNVVSGGAPRGKLNFLVCQALWLGQVQYRPEGNKE